MTREQAKELLPILEAYAEGKTIQHKVGDEWSDLSTPNFAGFDVKLYRVKPLEEYNEIPLFEEKTFRSFKSCNELVYYWEREKLGYSVNPLVMIEIWVKHKVDGRRRMIVGFGDNFVEVGVKAKLLTLEQLFEMYTFLDGSPCGKEESECGK